MRSWAFHGGSNSPDASCRPVWYREQQLQRFNAGEAIDVSRRSIYRWADRLEPFRQTSNTERTKIVGADLLSLVTYITAWPDATLDEMAVFIYNEGGVSIPVRESPNDLLS